MRLGIPKNVGLMTREIGQIWRWAPELCCAVLSVTTFCSFQREFSPLEVCGGEIGNARMIRFRLSGGCSRSSPGIRTRFVHRRADFLGIVDSASTNSQSAASTQLLIDISGSHVRHEVFRLNSIRDWHADLLATSSSAGMLPSWLLVRWGMTGKRLLVAQLKANPSLGSEAQRVRAFIGPPFADNRSCPRNPSTQIGRTMDVQVVANDDG